MDVTFQYLQETQNLLKISNFNILNKVALCFERASVYVQNRGGHHEQLYETYLVKRSNKLILLINSFSSSCADFESAKTPHRLGIRPKLCSHFLLEVASRISPVPMYDRPVVKHSARNMKLFPNKVYEINQLFVYARTNYCSMSDFREIWWILDK